MRCCMANTKYMSALEARGGVVSLNLKGPKP